MADANTVGAASVDVVANTAPLTAGLSAAEAQVRAFEAAATAAMARLSPPLQQLVQRFQQEGLSAQQAGSALNFFASSAEGAGNKAAVLSAFTAQLAVDQARAAAAAAQQTAAVASVSTAVASNTASMTANAAAAKAAKDALDGFSAAQLRSRMALTAQENAGALAGGAGRGDAAAAAATLAFQMRMQRQQAAEAASAAKATQAADAAEAASMAALASRADNLKAKLDPLAAVEAKRATAIAEADAMLAANLLTQEQYAAALALTATEYDAEAAAAVKAARATEGFTIQTTLAARETAVLGREALRGNWTRMVGSITLLAQAFSNLPLPILATVGALAVAVAAEIVYEQQMEHLRLTLAGVGAQSGLTAGELESAAERASAASSQGIYSTRASAEAFAAAGVTSQDTITTLSASVAEYAALTGTKAAEAQKTLAAAMEDPTKAAEGQVGAIANLTGAQLEEIKQLQNMGEKEKAAETLTNLLKGSMDLAAGSAKGLGGEIAILVKDLQALFDWIGRVDSQWGPFSAIVNAIVSISNPIYGIIPPALQEQSQIARDTAALPRRDRYGRAAPLSPYSAAATAASRAAQEVMDQSDPGISQYNDLIAQRAKLQAGVASGAPMGSSPQEVQHQIQALTDTINRHSKDGHYLSQNAIKDAELEAEATLRSAKAHHAKKEAIEADAAALARLRLAESGEVLTDAEAKKRADLTGDVAGASSGRGRKGPKDTFTPEQASVRADAQGYRDLAAAYLQSDEAALRLEATREALTRGVRAGRTPQQREQMIADQVDLDASKAAAEETKKLRDVENQAAMARRVNDDVAAGMDRREAERTEKIKEQFRVLQMLSESNLVDAKTRAVLTEAIKREKAALEELNKEADRTQAQDAAKKDRESLEVAQLEQRLGGRFQTRERAVAVARLQRQQQLGVNDLSGASADQLTSINSAGQTAGIKVDIEQAKQFDTITRSVTQETEALRTNAATYGMTYQQAEKYKELQKLLNEADRDGIQLTDQQRAALDGLAGAYASAADHAKKLADAQKGASEAAKTLGDDLEKTIETAIFNGKNLREEVRNIAIELGKAALKSALTGEGPFAGLMHTNESKVEGGPNKGILSQLIGGIFGQPGSLGHDRPSGRMADPIYVAASAGALTGLGGVLKAVGGSSGPVTAGSASGQLVSAAEKQFGLPQVGLPGTSTGTPDGSQAHPFYVNVVNGGANSGSNSASGSPFGALMSGLGGGIASLFGMGGAGGSMGGLSGGGIGGFFQRMIGGLGTIGGVGGGAAISGAAGAAALPADLVDLVHTGTWSVGTPGRMVPANPALFVHAPRLHNGLAPDEFPAILQRGERVTPRGGSSGRGSTSVTINVNGVTDVASFGRSHGQISRETKRHMSTVR